jgi:hypothetical protein
MGDIYYMSPVREVLERMAAHIEAALKELEQLRSEHPGLTERTDSEVK